MPDKNDRYYTEAERQAAMSVNILDFLRSNGYRLLPAGRDNFMLEEHDSLKISVDNLWCWFSHGDEAHGKGAISLLHEMGYANGNWVTIVKDLAKYAEDSGYIIGESFPTREQNHIYKKKTMEERHRDFELPKRAKNAKRMFAYLIKERGIDADIVWDLYFNKKLIYESEPYHNVVFVGQKDASGKVLYAGLRSAFSVYKNKDGSVNKEKKPFKGDHVNSDKEYCFAIEGNSHRLIVCEAPIDALSQATLTKLSGLDWELDHRIALGAIDDKPLERYLKIHPEIRELKLCLDNDINGKDHAGNPKNHGQIAAAKMKEKYEALGYEVHIYTPIHKDMNEDLLFQKKMLDCEIKKSEQPNIQDRKVNGYIKKAQEKKLSRKNGEVSAQCTKNAQINERLEYTH